MEVEARAALPAMGTSLPLSLTICLSQATFHLVSPATSFYFTFTFFVFCLGQVFSSPSFCLILSCFTPLTCRGTHCSLACRLAHIHLDLLSSGLSILILAISSPPPLTFSFFPFPLPLVPWSLYLLASLTAPTSVFSPSSCSMLPSLQSPLAFSLLSIRAVPLRMAPRGSPSTLGPHIAAVGRNTHSDVPGYLFMSLSPNKHAVELSRGSPEESAVGLHWNSLPAQRREGRWNV